MDKFGTAAQEWVLIGEVGELLTAMADHKRGRDTVDHIAEETADVEIMLAQLKIIHQCHDAVKAWRRKKLKRLWLRLKGA